MQELLLCCRQFTRREGGCYCPTQIPDASHMFVMLYVCYLVTQCTGSGWDELTFCRGAVLWICDQNSPDNTGRF